MSFAQSYILASKVRTKLTREASNPKSSLRVLVTQANMLDNLMDHIATETAKRNKFHSVVNEQIVEDQEEEVEDEEEEEDSSDDEFEVEVVSPRRISFSLPTRGRQLATSVAEYEVESDSDSDSDDDSDYYYSSEDDDEEEMESPLLHRSVSSPSIFRELPSINLQFQDEEEDDEESEKSDDELDHQEVPGLCRSPSLTDDEDFEHEHYKIDNHAYKATYQESIEFSDKNSSYTPIVNRTVHHQRHHAIMSMEAIL